VHQPELRRAVGECFHVVSVEVAPRVVRTARSLDDVAVPVEAQCRAPPARVP
jgi:hypothetical protein